MEEPGDEKTAKELTKCCSLMPSSMPSQKEGIVGTHNPEEDFSSPTPVKTKEPPRIKSKEELAELPEKYRILSEYFDRMTSSLRLLSLCKRTPTFQNISRQVEILTRRKFLCMHLAQIKYIIPEAVQIDKILTHDEKTMGMKSDMQIVLLFDVVEGHHEESAFVALSNLFSSRLRDFYISHPEGCDVPEAALPQPFNQRNITIKAESISKDFLSLSDTEILDPSHFPSSFRRHFYDEALTTEKEQTDLLSPIKSACVSNEDTEQLRLLPGSSSKTSMMESTPLKLADGSNNLVVETPVQSAPMRSISPTRSLLTCEDENKTTVSQNIKQSNSTVKKSLDFYSMDGEDTIISHKQISICLSDLVLLIHQIFQSVNFSPITKEELFQKIIMNNCEIDDHCEVETQVQHLEKLVPDWLCKKLAPSGDLLYK
ncbi:hypothetical protein BUALT_Bualt02G0130200 [Buddleja alternifolia]|uniref:CDT1 Geminin-binding domain-containing protein n=1 Tax=Buddleja alternifolia TaxID=168488 RepID=A0AAV6XZV7_9LAMI|nr:hypothetical protein BUALT_Bualt02G0130200 [Buddleja alternifolia]